MGFCRIQCEGICAVVHCFAMIGSTDGKLVDRLTQRWVQLTGTRVDMAANPWLDAPVGDFDRIGFEFFDRYAERAGYTKHASRNAGLFRFADLLPPLSLSDAVVDFYEHTARFEIDAWAEWCGVYRPFGRLLARLFSQRLQQLNVPLSSLDTSRGMTSDVVQLKDADGEIRHTLWLRRLIATGSVLYAGTYSLVQIPGCDVTCVKVAFPLPNGSAIVIMRPEVHSSGDLSLHSVGNGFGDPGFYFTVCSRDGRRWARYLKAMRETICVYADGDVTRADHVLKLWGTVFLRLHYRMRVPNGECNNR